MPELSAEQRHELEILLEAEIARKHSSYGYLTRLGRQFGISRERVRQVKNILLQKHSLHTFTSRRAYMEMHRDHLVALLNCIGSQEWQWQYDRWKEDMYATAEMLIALVKQQGEES